MPSLNLQQQKAVDTHTGPVLIIAGAGAGKTRVITHRILNLIKSGIAPDSILAITFTNKAAKEMKERVFDLLENEKSLNLPITADWQNEKPFVSTFHSLGVYIIRNHAKEFGLNRHFTIYDRTDSKRAVKEAMMQASVDPKKFDPGFILNKISLTKGDGLGRLQYLDSSKGFVEEIVAEVWEKYDAILAKDKALDFDDLLSKTAQLIGRNESLKKFYGNKWKYIHVDEYQDTNKVQYNLIKYLTEGHVLSGQEKNICVVGDIDQNIYSWRGATIENILNFEKDYPESQVITLEKNYRSTKIILAAANDVIKKNVMRREKTLYTDNVEGDKISILVSYTEDDEARSIADNARKLIENGVEAKEIAVLYRANFQSRALEEAFIKKNVPYQLLGTKFFERKEVKDVLAYIRAALNHGSLLQESHSSKGLHEAKRGVGDISENESWGDIARIINIPARGIGKVTVAKILNARSDLVTLPMPIQDKVREFFKLLEDIGKEIIEKKPSEVVKFVIKETGMERMYKKGDSEDEERLLNMQELVSVAMQYDSATVAEVRPPQPPHLEGIEKMLENAALATDQDEIKADKNAVRLMTVHASKGLEFEHVFIAGMEQNLFPFKHMDEEKVSKSEEEEERRLFYVALTRAKKRICLSYAIVRTIYGAQRVNTPSEFIDDIDKGLIEEQVVEKPTGAKAIFIDF
ncbi:MAG: UvrD-helicase domain-containing protein [Candidatus Paceibacterota bacterium]|jgi:DNA helicase-2/ATP-dependent DNA helicase PcrA